MTHADGSVLLTPKLRIDKVESRNLREDINGSTQKERILNAALKIINGNYDDQMNASAPGKIDDIGFQHIVR